MTGNIQIDRLRRVVYCILCSNPKNGSVTKNRLFIAEQPQKNGGYEFTRLPILPGREEVKLIESGGGIVKNRRRILTGNY